ncbi:MAG TPA: hypothetical protein DET40_21575 [Lentisphaeria bacterium]|nr:MAG: hypothetical protein A2X45_03485 [Lentisphaerae bacterium GWF2_50_93]HCE46143.1 hypothetical protein [Lentisphaeria bacterium]
MLQSAAKSAVEITDGGPIYTETLAGRFPVEPCNTISNFIFLIVIIYWAWKTRMNLARYPMVVIGVSILSIGFIGGTIYHATRSSEIWLMTDYMAIYFSIMAGCIYLWHRITGNWFLVLLYSILPALALRIIAGSFPVGEKHFIAVSYSTQVIMILLPVLIHCWLNKFRHLWVLALAFVSFAAALSFRELDAASGNFIPVGTHFLWHMFGGISAFLILHYIYSTSDFFYNKQKRG